MSYTHSVLLTISVYILDLTSNFRLRQANLLRDGNALIWIIWLLVIRAFWVSGSQVEWLAAREKRSAAQEAACSQLVFGLAGTGTAKAETMRSREGI